MASGNQLRQADIVRVMRHMADMAALKNDALAQRQVLIDGLNALLGTDAGFFYVADAWRPGCRPHFTSYTLSTQRDPVFLRYTSEFGVKFPLDEDPYCFQSIRDPRRVQAWTIRDVLPDRAAQRRHANFIDLKNTGRFCDGIVSFFRTGPDPDRVVGFGLHRFGGSRNLSARDVALATFAVSEIEHLVTRGHLALVPTSAPDLPPRLRQVLDRLLAGSNPKRIARELDLSVWTVREHIQRLYKHFDVNGRDELTARFIAPGENALGSAAATPSAVQSTTGVIATDGARMNTDR